MGLKGKINSSVREASSTYFVKVLNKCSKALLCQKENQKVGETTQTSTAGVRNKSSPKGKLLKKSISLFPIQLFKYPPSKEL